MGHSRHKAIQRWLGAALCLALLVGTQAAPADAKTRIDTSKIDPGLLQEILAADEDTEFDVIVRGTPQSELKNWDPDKSKDNYDRSQRASKSVEVKGGELEYSLAFIGGGAARMSGEEILDLLKDKAIDYVFRNAPVTAKWDPALDGPKAGTAGILAANVARAWQEHGVCGRGIGVAIVDSGVYPHPDLAGRIVASVDFSAVTATNTTPVTGQGDPGGHGTHVAGLVAGNGAASGGLYTGSAPCANIIDVRVIDATGSSNTGKILKGLQWVLANKNTYNIKVVNMSFGATQTASYKNDPLATAAEILTFAGITTVVSAGNSGPGPTTITSPASDPYVITVGALDDNETATLADDLLTTFSSRGRTKFDSHSKPDLVAPGRKMPSLLSPGSTIPAMYPERLVTAPGALAPQYLRLSGTSMAAPVVAGIAALMLERNSTLLPKQLKKRLKKTVTPLAFGTPDDRGAGLVNAAAAVGSIDPEEEYSEGRVSDAFAKDMRKFVQGQRIPWKSLAANGGASSAGIPWTSITWENITWDTVTWENITWENFTWLNITWEAITWETVTWQSSGALSVGAAPATSAKSGKRSKSEKRSESENDNESGKDGKGFGRHGDD